ncbi:acyltransferase [Amnibacterium soli]|uniref:acyltransferase family protein n=1 Tax=Amnibacterium soli TaxID=1282736 RepID=UPI0031EE24CB
MTTLERRAGRTPRLNTLTGLRFGAAALVLLHHVSYFLVPNGPFGNLFGSGYVGVAFFFVLSGFVLGWVHDGRVSLRDFYARRFARIYPLQLVTAAAAVPVVLILGVSLSWPRVIANLLLVHSWVPLESWGSSLNGASWSLACEAFFYAMFPVVIAVVTRVRFRTLAMTTFLALVVVAIAVRSSTSAEIASGLLYKGPWYRLGEFVLGVALAVAVRRGYRSRVSLNWAMAVAATTYGLIVGALPLLSVSTTRVVADLLILPATCLLIVAAATSDLDGRRNGFASNVVVKLGEASFALYMCHFLVLQMWTRFVAALMPVWLSCVVVIALSIALSIVLHQFVERPAERVLRFLLSSRAQPKRAVSIGADRYTDSGDGTNRASAEMSPGTR